MTAAVAHILDEGEQVPMSDDLTDDDFAALAEASFRALDAEEGQRA